MSTTEGGKALIVLIFTNTVCETLIVPCNQVLNSGVGEISLFLLEFFVANLECLVRYVCLAHVM